MLKKLLLFSIFVFCLLSFCSGSHALSYRLNKGALLLPTAKRGILKHNETLYLRGITGEETKNIKWKSLNKTIARVGKKWNSDKGRYEGCIYSTKKVGDTTIVAIYKGKSYRIRVSTKKTMLIDTKVNWENIKALNEDDLLTNVVMRTPNKNESKSLDKNMKKEFNTNVGVSIDTADDNSKNVTILVNYNIM